MGKILFINACVRPESRTRALAECLLDCLGGECEEVNITDGRIKPLDALSLDARNEKIREGDFSGDTFALARQFAEAETVVIAAPFWDLSFPACLKVYFENILVSDLTFAYKGGRPVGLCRAERLFYAIEGRTYGRAGRLYWGLNTNYPYDHSKFYEKWILGKGQVCYGPGVKDEDK